MVFFFKISFLMSLVVLRAVWASRHIADSPGSLAIVDTGDVFAIVAGAGAASVGTDGPETKRRHANMRNTQAGRGKLL